MADAGVDVSEVFDEGSVVNRYGVIDRNVADFVAGNRFKFFEFNIFEFKYV